MTRKIYILTLLPFILSSCFKEDEMVAPHEAGDVLTATAAMTQTYSRMIFFDLSDGSSVLETGKLEWDLAFESDPDGWRILLNTSRFMLAAGTGKYRLEDVTDTTGLQWRFDKSDGDSDSTALGPWIQVNGIDTGSAGEVYVIDLGYTSTGTKLGLRKLRVSEYDGLSYTIEYSHLDGNDMAEQIIEKQAGVTYVLYSLREHTLAEDAWPLPGTWDLWFTQYTTLLFTNAGDPYPYLVTGALINRHDGVEVAVDTLEEFGNITFEYADGLQYEPAADGIGYDWKYYEFNASSYSVLTGINYLIRTTEGYYYKLRFISFYNLQGEKGYPTFEFQRL